MDQEGNHKLTDLLIAQNMSNIQIVQKCETNMCKHQNGSLSEQLLLPSIDGKRQNISNIQTGAR